MKAALWSLLALVIALAIAFSYARGHHRNGYRKQRRKVRTILKIERDVHVVGDGAWPRQRAPREAEPMGM